ncbi:S8 family peptidase [Streptomyces sp. ISL-94]|uniref:S8 family peptidase n=1 Tax=Streptomyces sp. ISL-94 TaxID=2819190 RepID=UPI001BE70E33|nr:S8 family peptidase [Streptomyces sp. ISL-94]MBT2481984.1 S8 family peptidase [Streptomyces sp. ISL-94]
MATTPRRLSIALLPAALLTAGLQFAASPAHGAVVSGPEPRLAPSATAISDSWIVVLKDDVKESPDSVARELVKRNNGRLTHVYSSAVQGFATKMGLTQARALAADPRVASVEQDAEVAVSETQSNATWGIDRIDQRDLPLSGTYTYNTTASNVRVYVIDTGLRTAHTEFGGRASIGTDTVGDGQNGNDCNGHGTHVAGTAAGSTYGVAKAARIIGVRVLNCDGSGTTSGVIAGVDWVTANAVKPAVANMSLGGGANTSLDNAVKKSIASGVTYSLAAGNGNAFGQPQSACNSSPARVAEGITVGATDSADKRASWSNYGTCLDLFAPGVSITSAWKDSDTATKSISGTSMAAPHTAGAAALYLAGNPGATPAQVRDALVNGATTGKVQDPKTGSPNRLLHTLF